jgi:hypothetical protein
MHDPMPNMKPLYRPASILTHGQLEALLWRWSGAIELQANINRILLDGRERVAARLRAKQMRALCAEFDRAFPSPARLMAFHQECVVVDDRPWPLVTRMAAALHQTGRLDGENLFFSGAGHSLERDIVQVLARHVSGLPRWTHGAGMEYVLQQRVPGPPGTKGLPWTSIPHWGEWPRHAEQCVIAGYVQGQARWAVAIGNGMEPTFVFGWDAEGKSLRAQDVLSHELAQVRSYEMPVGPLQPSSQDLHTTPPELTHSTEPEQAQRPRCAA